MRMVISLQFPVVPGMKRILTITKGTEIIIALYGLMMD